MYWNSSTVFAAPWTEQRYMFGLRYPHGTKSGMEMFKYCSRSRVQCNLVSQGCFRAIDHLLSNGYMRIHPRTNYHSPHERCSDVVEHIAPSFLLSGCQRALKSARQNVLIGGITAECYVSPQSRIQLDWVHSRCVGGEVVNHRVLFHGIDTERGSRSHKCAVQAMLSLLLYGL